MIQSIMVTGSSGTIGTALVQELIQKKYKVIPVDIKPSIWDKKIDKATIQLDLRKPIPSKVTKQKPDIIIHLAANARVHDLVLDPQKALDNYTMTHNVLEYARLNHIDKVIFASSREVYGESTTNLKRKESSTHVTKIKSPYTASKYAGEALIHSYYECFGIKTVIVRFSNVYGRFDISERAVPLFIYYAKRNRDINIFGAEKKLDFTYTDDVLSGICQIVNKFDKVSPDTFNLTFGKGTTIIDVAKKIIRNLESKSKLIIGDKRTGEISSFVADISKAQKLFGYRPKFDIDRGLEYNISWYLNSMKTKKYYDYQVRDLKKRGWA